MKISKIFPIVACTRLENLNLMRCNCRFRSRLKTFCSTPGLRGQDSVSDDRLSKFSKAWYWRNRYQTEIHDGFEWFLPLDDALEAVVKRTNQITARSEHPVSCLELGCGLSQLTLALVAHSSQSLDATLIDFAPEALLYQGQQWKNLCKRYGRTPGYVQLICADIKCLPLQDEHFDIILDKGTMDALVKDRLNGMNNATLMLSEVLRVMIPGGIYLQISDEDPDSRQLYLEKLKTLALQNLKRTDPSSAHHNGVQQESQEHNGLNLSLSPWRFEIIKSHSNSEYFLYWIERLKH